MRILSNYEHRFLHTIREAMLDLLLLEIARAESSAPAEIWVVSPWIRNFEFNTGSRGRMRLVQSNMPSRVSLRELLVHFVELGGKLKMVCLPPDELIQASKIRSLARLYGLRGEVQTSDTETIGALSKEMERLTEELLTHKPMLDFLAALTRASNPNVELYYNQNLHAKVYVGTDVVVFGSANLTNRGLTSSDELCAISTDTEVVTQVKRFCADLITRDFSSRSSSYAPDDFRDLPETKKLHPSISATIQLVTNNLLSKDWKSAKSSSKNYAPINEP